MNNDRSSSRWSCKDPSWHWIEKASNSITPKSSRSGSRRLSRIPRVVLTLFCDTQVNLGIVVRLSQSSLWQAYRLTGNNDRSILVDVDEFHFCIYYLL
jgi:hypothetical protein